MESLYGAVLINTAVSYLNADVSQKLRSDIDGSIVLKAEETPLDPLVTTSRFKGSGTSLGINTGVGWAGRVPSTGV